MTEKSLWKILVPDNIANVLTIRILNPHICY